MNQIGNGVSDFLKETSLHGFKYLTFRTGSLLRIIWALVLLASFSIALMLILESVSTWKGSPVIITLESTDGPWQEVQFPTVTICHEPEYQADNWAIPELVLNHLNFEKCWDVNCSEVIDTKYISLKIMDYASSLIEKVYNSKMDKTLPEAEAYSILENALLKNLTSFDILKEKLAEKKSYFGSIGSFVKSLNLTNPKENIECQNCTELREKVKKFMLMGESMSYIKKRIGFGSFLRTMATILGVTFDSQDKLSFLVENNEFEIFTLMDNANCSLMTSFDKDFHELMSKVSVAFGLKNVSIFDLPNFYKTQDPAFSQELRMDVPMHSLCAAQIWEPQGWMHWKNEMPVHWSPILDNSSSRHDFWVGKVPGITGNNMTAIMKVMKFAFHMASKDDFLWLHEQLKSLNLPYDMVDESHMKSELNLLDTTFPTKFARPFITEHADIHEDLTHGFEPVLTTNGLCSAWNHGTMNHVYAESNYLNSFEKVFNQPKHYHQVHTAPLKKISFLLDKQEYYLPDRIKHAKNFIISLNSENSFFDLLASPISIQRGYKTTISVKPLTVESDDNIQRAPIGQRKCRFEHETPENMTLFKSYSVSSCTFECMIKYSADFCKCIPWDFPRPDNDSIPICDSYHGNSCFHLKLIDYEHMGSSCYCLPSCNSVKFSHSEKTSPLRFEKECNSWGGGKGVTWLKYNNIKSKITKLSHFVSTYQNNTPTDWEKVLDLNIPATEYCKLLYSEDIAVVEIEIDGYSYTKMRQSLRATMTDKLGAIGGTLGLFTGFSLLALVEALYWMCICGFNVGKEMVQNAKKKKEQMA